MARLLLVDDDPDLLDVECQVLRIAGYEVLSADSAQTALDCFRACRPDLVIMDFLLPSPDEGAALIRDLGPDARVIVLSGRTLDISVAQRVLKKPCPPRVLLQAIAELL